MSSALSPLSNAISSTSRAGLAKKLPLAIGNAALDGHGKVTIGGRKVMDVPPSLALVARGIRRRSRRPLARFALIC